MLATRNPDGPPRPGRRRRLLAAAGLAAALVAPASPAGAAPPPAPPAASGTAPQTAVGTVSQAAPGTAPAPAAAADGGTSLAAPGTAAAASGTAPAAAADGFASVSALGQNGTTGGAGGPVVTVTTTAQFLDHIARPGPYVIQVAGTITLPTGANDGMWNVASDKTIVGLGDDATLSGGGLNIGVPVDDDVTSPPANAVHNIIIRNLHLTGATDDLINVQMFSHHIWIDHNEFSNGDDGAVDIKRGSDFVTVSWNHFHDHDKTLLLGHDEDAGPQDIGRLRVTYHHNFFDRSDQRNPRVRFSALAHVYNNHYNDNSYGVASTYDAAVLMENNYFYSVNNPGRVASAATSAASSSGATSWSPATTRSRPGARCRTRAGTTRTPSTRPRACRPSSRRAPGPARPRPPPRRPPRARTASPPWPRSARTAPPAAPADRP
ncbi:hypothetical protein AB0J85_10360 [Micromonospora echinofusca]|uniref:pectate lyase family protein n=1 Tax=Micromonospora echinofusca TaxID=47858 RepID=UPI00341A6437